MRTARWLEGRTIRRQIYKSAGGLCLAAVATPLLLPNVAFAAAAALERNLPPLPAAHAVTPAPPNLPPNGASAAPIDGPLRALVLLSPTDSIVLPGGAAPGIDAHRVAFADTAGLTSKLEPFLGQRLSLKLIGEIEASIARYYRDKGHPFVSVSTPPQEVTGGMLQIAVDEFHLGNITSKAPGRMSAQQAEMGVRAALGQPIDANQLAQDLDWLNRSPFRAVSAEFSPGNRRGETNLSLNVTETKPWSAYLGYDNSGTAETDFNRLFAGLTVGDVPSIGSVLTYQLTASPDFYGLEGSSFGADLHPKYLSNAGRVVIPTGARQDVEASLSTVETNVTSAPFATRTDTLELSAGYRTAFTTLSALELDAIGGIEAKHEARSTTFGGVPATAASQDIFQGYLGLAGQWAVTQGSGNGTVTLHVSPANLGGGNSDAALSTYSLGRVGSAAYAYADLDLATRTDLPAGWALTSTLDAQFALQPLPDTEQIAIGGAQAVRGYSSDDGSFDAGAVLQNELHLPVLSLQTVTLDPYALADFGYGRDIAGGTGTSAASLGAGVNFNFGSSTALGLSGAYALLDAPVTKAHDWSIDVSAKAQY
jgi:hemolysin activation/secretion protein